MKKQIKEKGLLLIIIIIFFAAIAVIFSSCKKQAGPETEKIATLASPTIIYTDVNPDSAITGNSEFNLDLNNDGIYDFTLKTIFRTISCGSRCTGINQNIANVVPATGTNNGIVYKLADYLVSPLDSQAIIDSSNQWSYITNRSLIIYVLDSRSCGECSSYGFWGSLDKYMGLKLIKDSKIYFGWVRLYLKTSLHKLILKDYAYNSRPGRAIRAGQRY